MLFNTINFVLFFSVTIALFFGVSRACRAMHRDPVLPSLVILLIAALYFYASWDIMQLPVMVGSLFITYVCSRIVSKLQSNNVSPMTARIAFVLSLFAILTPLAYFKYSHFVITNINAAFGLSISSQQHVLPLGISFFTFTLIAFFVDVYKKRITECGVIEYASVVSFFPHLIAGPILLHHDIIPQLKDSNFSRLRDVNIAIGLCLFSLGLFKKVYLADPIGAFATPVFDAVAQGGIPNANACWRAALFYTLQLYFDFSGYSDMAIGISTMMGIYIPANFFSPYKSSGIIEFWRRWHISLAVFLKEYLYIPLGGSRVGEFRKYVNIMAVMVICGIWHGAGWTFILWGFYHGILLVVNHAWRKFKSIHPGFGIHKNVAVVVSTLCTFLLITVGWVIFRADSVGSAFVLLKGMAGLNTPSIEKFRFVGTEKMLVLQLAIIFLLPNSHQFFMKYRHATNIPRNDTPPRFLEKISFAPNLMTAVSLSVLVSTLAYVLAVGKFDQIFLYCQF